MNVCLNGIHCEHTETEDEWILRSPLLTPRDTVEISGETEQGGSPEQLPNDHRMNWSR